MGRWGWEAREGVSVQCEGGEVRGVWGEVVLMVRLGKERAARVGQQQEVAVSSDQLISSVSLQKEALLLLLQF